MKEQVKQILLNTEINYDYCGNPNAHDLRVAEQVANEYRLTETSIDTVLSRYKVADLIGETRTCIGEDPTVEDIVYYLVDECGHQMCAEMDEDYGAYPSYSGGITFFNNTKTPHY